MDAENIRAGREKSDSVVTHPQVVARPELGAAVAQIRTMLSPLNGLSALAPTIPMLDYEIDDDDNDPYRLSVKFKNAPVGFSVRGELTREEGLDNGQRFIDRQNSLYGKPLGGTVSRLLEYEVRHQDYNAEDVMTTTGHFQYAVVDNKLLLTNAEYQFKPDEKDKSPVLVKENRAHDDHGRLKEVEVSRCEATNIYGDLKIRSSKLTINYDQAGKIIGGTMKLDKGDEVNWSLVDQNNIRITRPMRWTGGHLDAPAKEITVSFDTDALLQLASPKALLTVQDVVLPGMKQDFLEINTKLDRAVAIYPSTDDHALEEDDGLAE